MPVPLPKAGSFAAGLREDEKMSGLAPAPSQGDRELGGIAQYELRFTYPVGAGAELDDEQPFLLWLTQAVVLLDDADAAARWLVAKTRRFEDLEGQVVDGDLYRKVEVDMAFAGLGEEAALVVAHTETARGGLPFCETYINFRTGRVFGGVGATTYKELEVLPQLGELADTFLSRMESVLRKEAESRHEP